MNKMENSENKANMFAAHRLNRWGMVLAGGDGTRLRPLTQIIYGDERPKQFCPLFEGQTLLAHALQRAEQVVPPERLLVSLTTHHRKWYSQESRMRTDQRVVQPANRGTAPAIVHSLLSIASMDPEAEVVIFPSDHHFSDEPLFVAELEAAFANVEQHPDAVVLLGALPDTPEVGYGWIELGSSVGADNLFHVRAFREKPSLKVARELLHQDTAWNTFVMVGRVQVFLEMLEASLPDLTSRLGSTQLWNGTETIIEDSVYQQMPSADFSRQVLSTETEHLLVMRLKQVGWNDLGDPERVLATAQANGYEPGWAAKWRQADREKGDSRAVHAALVSA